MLVKITNGRVERYPYSIGELKKSQPNVSWPSTITTDLLESHGVYQVDPTTPPTHDSSVQYLREGEPVLQDGVWCQTWSVVDYTEEELNEITSASASSVRSKRNQLLAACDWTQAKDIGDEVSSLWAVYRQALRDIPNQEGFPHTVNWPLAPT